jgi:hypothetical protein
MNGLLMMAGMQELLSELLENPFEIRGISDRC